MTCPISNKTFLSVLLFGIVALALGIGFNVWHAKKTHVVAPSVGTMIDTPQPIPEFHLVNGFNQPFTNLNLKGHYSFLFFGFTHCQNICPLTMTLLTQLYSELNAEKWPLPQIVFITLDPRHDTPQVVGAYVHAFNPRFIGVTGPSAGIQQLSKQLGVVYLQHDSSENNSQIDHSGTLYLINPDAQLVAIFSPPHNKTNIKKDYKTIVRPHE